MAKASAVVDGIKRIRSEIAKYDGIAAKATARADELRAELKEVGDAMQGKVELTTRKKRARAVDQTAPASDAPGTSDTSGTVSVPRQSH